MLDDGKEVQLLQSLGLAAGESKVYLKLLSQPGGEMVEKVVTSVWNACTDC